MNLHYCHPREGGDPDSALIFQIKLKKVAFLRNALFLLDPRLRGDDKSEGRQRDPKIRPSLIPRNSLPQTDPKDVRQSRLRPLHRGDALFQPTLRRQYLNEPMALYL